ncbi:MAG: hypothetical protein AAFY60_17670, partial [Myxococcota bacterium]
DSVLYITTRSGHFRFDPLSNDLSRFSDRSGVRIWADSRAIYSDTPDGEGRYTLWRTPRP